MSGGAKGLLALLLVASGAAGLSYEVVWLRCLSNALGSSALATAITLSVFMVGMASGAFAMGRLADRCRSPLALFGLLELLVGGSAWLVPLAARAVERLDFLFPGSDPAQGLVLRGVACAAVLFVPTFVMGGTLPALAAHVGRRLGGGNERFFTLLYSVHVAGAAGGALLSSFAAIPALGLRGTSAAGSALNVAVAIGAFALARARPSPVVEPPTPEVAAASASAPLPSPSPSSVSLLDHVTAFLSGFVLLASEVVFVRTLVLALTAKVHSFALMLGVFLVGLALASLIASRLRARIVRDPGLIALALLLGAGGALLCREAPLWLDPIFLAPAARQGSMGLARYVVGAIALSCATMWPLALPLGLVLPSLLRRAVSQAERPGRATGSLLFWNTVGSAAGPLLAPWQLIERWGLQGTLYLFAIGAAAASVPWLARTFRGGSASRALRFGSLATAALVGASCFVAPARFGGTPELDATLFAQAGPNGASSIVHYREGATVTVTVTARGGRPSLRLDGFEAAGVPGEKTQVYQYMRVMAHLPMVLHGGQVERALVICCGTGTTAGAVAAGGAKEVDVVDIHPEVFESLPRFAEANRNLDQDPRVRRIVDDGRAFLRRCTAAYDVITLEPMPPQYAGMTQLYSVGFYESCRRALKPGGVVCQWLPFHLMTREQALAATAAMARVFKTTQVWEHAQTGMLIGSDRDLLPLTPQLLAAAQADPEVAKELQQAGLRSLVELADDFLCDARDLAGALAGVDPIEDDRPELEYGLVGYGLTSWTPLEAALIREPFFRARLDATLPLRAGSPAAEEPIRLEWSGRGLARYAAFLSNSGRGSEARQLLEERVRQKPELARVPFLRAVRQGLSKDE